MKQISIPLFAIIALGLQSHAATFQGSNSADSVQIQLGDLPLLIPGTIAPVSQKTDIISFQDGDDLVQRHRPGRTTLGTIQFSFPVYGNPEFFERLNVLYEDVKQGQVVRMDLSIQIDDPTGYAAHQASWADSLVVVRANNTWPSGLDLSVVDGILHCEVELAVENLQIPSIRRSTQTSQQATQASAPANEVVKEGPKRPSIEKEKAQIAKRPEVYKKEDAVRLEKQEQVSKADLMELAKEKRQPSKSK